MSKPNTKELPGQKKLPDSAYPAGQPESARESKVGKPKLSERDRYILTNLMQASKACKALVKKIRSGESVEPRVVSAASILAAAYGDALMGNTE